MLTILHALRFFARRPAADSDVLLVSVAGTDAEGVAGTYLPDFTGSITTSSTWTKSGGGHSLIWLGAEATPVGRDAYESGWVIGDAAVAIYWAENDGIAGGSANPASWTWHQGDGSGTVTVSRA